MSRKQLSDLIRSYLDGTCSEKEREMMDYWYQFLDQDLEEGTETERTEILKERLWEKITSHNQEIESAAERNSGWLTGQWLRMAVAIIAVVLGGWFLMYNYSSGVSKEEKPLVVFNQHVSEKTNYTQQNRVQVLPDGSRIALEPGSSLEYKEPFQDRTVFLTGNAFFDIAKDSLRPFTVYAGDIVTRVLGTSFFIRSGQGKNLTAGESPDMEVAVVTGRVMVEKKTDSEKDAGGDRSIVLTPNQKVTYSHKDKHFVRSIVEEPVLNKPIEIIRRNNWFQFADTPVGEVLNRLEEAYQLEIEVTEGTVINCPITADLTDQPLFTKLDLICAALKASYRQDGPRIIIEGGSCN